MLIFIDLDGTLVDTVAPEWKPYRDGEKDSSRIQIPFIDGAIKFISSRQKKGDFLVIVSDSHPKHVNVIADKLGLEAISLSDKPNMNKINAFLREHKEYQQLVDKGNCVFIGDTKLDIELGRRLGGLTIWLHPLTIPNDMIDQRDGIGDDRASIKMGPTFATKNFREVENILDNPLSHLYAIEAAFVKTQSSRSIKFSMLHYFDNSFSCIRCLARQEQGNCDKYARADQYYQISNPNRSQEFIKTLAKGISSFLNRPEFMQFKWDYFTYLTDKNTTTPQNKMKEIFDAVETTIPKIELLKWSDCTEGSLRNQNLYNERKEFLEKFLSVNESLFTVNGIGRSIDVSKPLQNKNIVVLDDQLTTGATAYYVIKLLKNLGANNVIFIAMFQMISDVNRNDVLCPRCGMPMSIKIKRETGSRFYSCVPPRFKGNGCGYTLNIQ